MRRIAAAALAALLWLGGGAIVRADESTARDPRLDSLQRELLKLRQEKTVAEVESARLRQVITRLEAELAAVRLELTRNVRGEADAAGTELPRTELPRAESPESELSGSESVQETLVSVQETLVGEAPIGERTFIEVEDLTDEELGERPTETLATPSAGLDSSAQTLYDQSYTQFHENRYREAEAGFQRFLDDYPETDLTDNAQYWVGECRFAQQRFEEALEAFLLTVERFPHGNKVPDAFYKAGRCLEMQGARDRAIQTYEQTLSRFPSSAAAVSARERLAALR